MYRTLDPDTLGDALGPLRGRLLIVDYDETLWLRNSTEEFLARAKPAWLAATLLRILDKLRPWRVIGGRGGAVFYRDWIRLMAIVVAMPWTIFAWRRAAPQLGRLHANARLEDLILHSGANRVVILSNGFLPIIKPLQSNSPLSTAAILASSVTGGARWRKLGKRQIAEANFSSEELDSATLITDHISDEDLLNRVGNGILCAWPDAHYRRAFKPQPPAVTPSR